MTDSENPVIHWFRRDLRLLDNTALRAASDAGAPVIPLYVTSSWRRAHSWTGAKRQHFLCQNLESLSRNLETIDGTLVIRSGDAVDAILELAKQTGAQSIFYNEDPDPFGKRIEERLQKACRELDLECRGFHDHTLHGPGDILTQAEQPYRVYTPYSRNWLGQEKPEPQGKPKNLRTPAGIQSEPIPTLSHWSLTLDPGAECLEGGERAAQNRLKTALNQRLSGYADHRDTPSVLGTSRLSQDLRFGLLSIRTVYKKAAQAEHAANSESAKKGIQTFIKELAWREFYMAILHHHPHVLEEEFMADWRGLPWDEPGDGFEAWKSGTTGFPIVDAGMRELLTTGFMHNRVRMITAMFLTKDLHIDWRLGESFFMQHLLDGEIASNNGGWQWSAGTGADAAPYFRIQNPWSQSKRHDPNATYIKRWIPELAEVPAKLIHQPPEDGRPIAEGYPLPCVDHATERARTLAIFKKHRAQASR
jgi:deoxyribodipyrimidine photo-lyase